MPTITPQRKRRHLALECLEVRAVPATRLYVEDFTHDTRTTRAQYDTARDGLLIAYAPGTGIATGASFVPTAVGSPPSSPAPGFSLRLAPNDRTSMGHYVASVTRGPRPGEINDWESVISVSVRVRGNGYVNFLGGAYLSYAIDVPAGQWRVITVTPTTTDQSGHPFGQFNGIDASTFSGELLLDDVTVEVETNGPRPPTVGAGEVHVNRFGNGLGIVGDDGNNLVQVDLLYDAGGTIRVSGPGLATKIIAGRGATQIDEYTVVVADFAHNQTFDQEDRPQFDERDLLINLHGGDDQLIVAGAAWNVPSIPPTVDDLFITMSGGDSLAVLTDVVLWDALLYKAGRGRDSLGVFGKSFLIGGLQVDTGGGDDDVQFGTPGALVFDGEDPGDLTIHGEEPVSPHGVTRLLNWVKTGGGNDTVLVSGGVYDYLSFDLGGGDDEIRFESAEIYNRLDVRPGAGRDRIDIVEANVPVILQQDAFDTVRVHRFWLHTVRLRGKAGAHFELPASGTQYRAYEGGSFGSILPDDPSLNAMLGQILSVASDDQAVAKSSIAFAPGDF